MSFELIHPAAAVCLILLAALIAPLFGRASDRVSAGLMGGVMALVFTFLAVAGREVWSGKMWRGSLDWAPELGMRWDLWISPMGLLMALLVSGVGTLVAVYASAYLSGDPNRGRFFSTFFLFAAAMMGLAVTENLLVFFVFWELTSLASYLLIGYYHRKAESRKSALDALLVTGSGGVVLLAGILLLGEAGGSYRIGELIDHRDHILAHSLYPAILGCFLFGAVTKSAQVPFHFWLPGAMAAPAPVSAYLHSATMVKAGIFLLAIIHPVLGGTPAWHFSLLFLGVLTMTWGALVAVVQTDLKRLLAFSTVSALGTLVMLLGIENALAAKTVVVFLIVHALYKGALFMVAGVLEKTTGTRDVNQLRGLMRSMPALGIAAVLAAASMSGIPPFVGFIAKELLYELKLETPVVGWSLLICGVVANSATIVVAIQVGLAPFLGPSENAPALKKKPPPALWLGALVLALAGIVLGIFPGLMAPVVESAASQIKMEPVAVKLKLWHGFNLVLLLSALTVALGIAGFRFRNCWRRIGSWLGDSLGVRGQSVFRSGLQQFVTLAGFLTRCLQSGNLRQYFAVIIFTASLLLVAAFVRTAYSFESITQQPFRLDVFFVLALVALGVVGTIRNRRRMTVILFLGCGGFGIAGLFALYGAPDLAITQLLVETLTLVLFALAIYGLPRLEVVRSSAGDRFLPIALSVTMGIVFTLLTLKALDLNIHDPVSLEIAERSYPEAYGRNVVNVILVDFRALDTLGEVAVLVVAALGVAAMLPAPASGLVSRTLARQRSAVLLASARYTVPAMLVFSLYILLRGHNEPGGGFSGGLIASMALILSHLAQPDRSLMVARQRPYRLAAAGLLIAAISGLPGLLGEGSFLAAWWGAEAWLPAVGKIKLGTPLLFDIGVYLAVAGVVLLLYETMERWHASRCVSSTGSHLSPESLSSR